MLKSGLCRPGGPQITKKKQWNRKMAVIIIVISVLGIIPKGMDWKTWKLENKQRPSKLQNC